MNLAIYKERFTNNRNALIEEYNKIARQDSDERKLNMKPGEKLLPGDYDGFYYLENRDKASQIIGKYRDNAYVILKDIYNEISGYMSEVPTEETTRALQSMKLIKEPTQEYIDSMVEKHGNNYTALNVLSEYAREHNMFINAPDTIKDNEKAHQYYASLKAETNFYNTAQIQKVSPAYIGFCEEILR